MKLNWCRLQSGDPGLEAALGSASLSFARSLGEPLLIFDQPAPVVSFSGLDRVSPSFTEAVAAARSGGAAAVSRISGGRAVAAHTGCLRLTFAAPHPRGEIDVQARFSSLSRPILSALRALGVDAHLGEIDGEWCPGGASINLSHRRKLVGIGQRSTADAHHLCALITVSEGDLIVDMLDPVYRSLGYPFSREAVGWLEGLPVSGLQGATVESMSAEWDLQEVAPPPLVLAEARAVKDSFLV